MTVANTMIAQPVTVESDETIESALRLMQQHGFWHLPVVEGQKLVGMIGDSVAHSVLREREVARAQHPRPMSAEFRRRFEPRQEPRVHEVREPAVCIAPDEDLSLAAWRMLEADVRALCVTERGRLVGFITAFDLLRAFERGCRSRSLGGDGAFADPEVGRCMTTQMNQLDGEDRLGEAVGRLLGAATREVPVMSRGELVGMLGEPALRAGLDESGGGVGTATKVATVMSAPPRAFDRAMPLSRAAGEMLAKKVTALPVTGKGRLVGLITQTDVLEHCATGQPLSTDAEFEALVLGR